MSNLNLGIFKKVGKALPKKVSRRKSEQQFEIYVEKGYERKGSLWEVNNMSAFLFY